MSAVCESLDELLRSASRSEEVADHSRNSLGADDEDDDIRSSSLETQQALICQDLIEHLQVLAEEHQTKVSSNNKRSSTKADGASNSSGPGSPQAHNFIHTSIDYNNRNNSSDNENNRRNETPSSNAMTIREVFAGSNSALYGLPPVLASLMTKRVETEKLLPCTQDADANEEAMSSSAALTLTRPALIAADLYAKLLAMPGAWGSGLIEMEAVSGLSALFKRWRVECITAVDMLVSEKKGAAKNKAKKKSSGKRKPTKSKETNPHKRGRGSRTRAISFADDDASSDEESEDDHHDEDSDDEDSPATMKQPRLQVQDDEDENGGIILPTDLLVLGLRAALSLAEVPMQKEFMSWSCESREAVIEALTSFYGTACALTAKTEAKAKLGDTIVGLRDSVVDQATTCLKQCILTSGAASDDDDLDDATQGKVSVSAKRHETAVFIFRGLFPLMAMKEHVPNSEKGKQLACDTVAETLQGFVKGVGEDMEDKNSLWTPASTRHEAAGSSTGKKTPSTRRASLSNVDLSTAVTPKTTSKKARRKRVSFGGVDTTGKTPALKSGKKTPKSTFARSTYAGTKPRPVLSAVLGLLQKLATTKGLDRAQLRNSIVKSLHGCVGYLPPLERTHFLRFLHQLCLSKVSVHRLVGAEVLGAVLSESWLWNDHKHLPLGTPKANDSFQSNANTPRSKTPSRRDSVASLSGVLLETPSQESEGADLPSSLLDALLGRLLDRAPAVRARAAGSLAELLRKVAVAVQDENQDESVNAMVELRKTLGATGFALLNSLRKRALNDEKSTVRKACTDALVQLVLLGHSDDSFSFGISEEEVCAFGQICQDNSMLTRRTAAQALTFLLETSAQGSLKSVRDRSIAALVERTWTSSVLPMALDPEIGCATKAIDLIYQVVIQPIAVDEEDPEFDRLAFQTAWRILALVCESSGSGSDLTGCLQAAITKLTTTSESGGQRDVSRALLRRICDVAVVTLQGPLEDLCETELEAQRSGVWCLFDALVDQASNLKALYSTLKKLRVDLDFLGTSWEKMLELLEMPTLPVKSANMLRACMRSCLRLLSKLAACVKAEVAQESATNLHSMLQKFVLPPDLIGSAVSALAATSIVCSGKEVDLDQVRKDCSDRLDSLYNTCEESMSSYAKQTVETGLPASEMLQETTVRAIFTVGELAIVGFSPDEDAESKTGKNKKKSSATEASPLRGMKAKPSRRLVDLVLTFLPRTLLASVSTPTPEAARAHAFIAVGKICLRDGQLAKKCVNMLARELHGNTNDGCPSVQSNALLVLGDLCIRYTSMVDRYLPVMAGCLQAGLDLDETIFQNSSAAKAAVVRKNAILLLSGLLLQDYVKWRGLLFHRFLVASADSDETVAEIGKSILVGPLLSKSPKLFFNNFVESLFVLNRCMHPIYIAAKSQGDGGAGVAVDFDGINLTGPTGKARRVQMYELMLAKMSDEEKIGITARLAKEVLGSALSSDTDLHRVCVNPRSTTDASVPVDRKYESAFNVLSDAFDLLSSPSLRVGKSSKAADDEDQDVIEDPNVPTPSSSNKRVLAAKGKLLSKISRKHMIEIVFPILRNLRVLLQKSCSPLSKNLSEYMLSIYRSYKSEVEDHLQNDLNLLQEIQFDYRNSKKSGGSSPDAAAAADGGSPTAAGEEE